MRKSLILIILILNALATSAQLNFLDLEYRQENRRIDFLEVGSDVHLAVRPYQVRDHQSFRSDSLDRELHFQNNFTSTWIGRALLNEHFLQVREDDFDLSIDPVFIFEGGYDSGLGGIEAFRNTRGLRVQGRIGDKVFFRSGFYETQARFPSYINRFIEQTEVVPGENLAREFYGDAWDYYWAEGLVSYSPSKHFNFSFGHDKNFIGTGHRSLLLSDQSFVYPQLRITTDVWKLKYVLIYTQMNDIRPAVRRNGVYQNKFVSAHYLSWQANKRLSIGLFEGVSYADTSGLRGMQMGLLNPVIFWRSVENSQGSFIGNVLLGFNMDYRLNDNVVFYGQFILDEFKLSEVRAGNGWWANKYGFQLGYRMHDILGWKGFRYLGEYNQVRPYTYSHADVSMNWGHYNQSLAHPLGANFQEIVQRFSYFKGRWYAELQFNYSWQGLDRDGENWGSDIYYSYETREQDYDNNMLQGVPSDVLFLAANASYLLNPAWKIYLELGFQSRIQTTAESVSRYDLGDSNYLYLALKTRLFNQHFDR
jgi:hypothetical protein